MAVLDQTQFNELVSEVLAALQAQSQGVGDIEKVTSLDNLVSLPALRLVGATETVVEAPLELLSSPATLAAADTRQAIQDAVTATVNAIAAADIANLNSTTLDELKEAVINATNDAFSAFSLASSGAMSAENAAAYALIVAAYLQFKLADAEVVITSSQSGLEALQDLGNMVRNQVSISVATQSDAILAGEQLTTLQKIVADYMESAVREIVYMQAKASELSTDTTLAINDLLQAVEGAKQATTDTLLVKAAADVAASQAVVAAENADDTASHPTYIGEDNYVYTWDKVGQVYNKTTIYVKGNPGTTMKVLGHYDTLAQLQAAIPDGSSLDGMYAVGTNVPYSYYAFYDGSWKDQGQLKGEKGDPFTYADFTQSEIDGLKQPAVDAAAVANTAAQNANAKATLADTKASLADSAATNAAEKAALADAKASLAAEKAALAQSAAVIASQYKLPTGTVIERLMGAPDDTWLPCDGSMVEGADYPLLNLTKLPVSTGSVATVNSIGNGILITYQNGMYVRSPKDYYRLSYKSSDGVNWTDIKNGSDNLSNVIYFNGKWYGYLSSYLYSSADLNTWTQVLNVGSNYTYMHCTDEYLIINNSGVTNVYDKTLTLVVSFSTKIIPAILGGTMCAFYSYSQSVSYNSSSVSIDILSGKKIISFTSHTTIDYASPLYDKGYPISNAWFYQMATGNDLLVICNKSNSYYTVANGQGRSFLDMFAYAILIDKDLKVRLVEIPNLLSSSLSGDYKYNTSVSFANGYFFIINNASCAVTRDFNTFYTFLFRAEEKNINITTVSFANGKYFFTDPTRIWTFEESDIMVLPYKPGSYIKVLEDGDSGLPPA